MPGALAQGDTVVPSRLPKELLEKSGFLMVRLGMDFKARALAELEAAGFSQHHYSVLALLGEQARETQLTIADALGLDPSQLVGILDGLEKRGLIERQQREEGAPIVRVRIKGLAAPQGSRLLDPVIEPGVQCP